MLIDAWMPAWDVREVHETHVAAGRERVWRALRTTSFARSPAIALLGALRSLPALFARHRYARSPFDTTLEALLRGGFALLEERPEEEMVLGLAGRFWCPSGGVVRVTPDEFRAFDRPGYATAAWNFRLADAGGGARLSTETRVRCSDAASRRRFLRYWRLIAPFSGLIRREMLRLVRQTAEARSSTRFPPGERRSVDENRA